MFKRKQDVDKHVLSVLNRKKDEKERHAQGYQIARLYLEIKEYETAKRYLGNFLKIRENSPQAHQMMGEINEALGKKELAIDNYKRALDCAGLGSSYRQLVLKISELYCDIEADEQRMKYWLQKCEESFPKSEVVFRLKSKIASISGTSSSGSNGEMERLLLDEMIKKPKDVELRIKLLELYLETGQVEEAYNAAIDTDLTTAFVNSLPWYECVWKCFEMYHESHPDWENDVESLLMNLHVLRCVTVLGLHSKDLQTSVHRFKKLDDAVKKAASSNISEESWLALVKELKGQVLYIAGLFILKRAMMGSIQWQEANHLSGACFLASSTVKPIDGQATWFVKPKQQYNKFYTWWHLQSYDRFSQISHMVQQLSQHDVTEWTKTIHQQVMNEMGQKLIFEAIFSSRGASNETHVADSFLLDTYLLIGKVQDPLTQRQLMDIDRVAYQVHLDRLSNLVWLCLHRYSSSMEFQPNYHFQLMENIVFSVKNIETASTSNLCQLDILTFLLATVRCAASSMSENVFSYEDQSGRPTLLPMCLSRSFCTQEQEEWWEAAYKFCSNTAKDNFSHLRRVLIRGIEVVRLKGSHGVSIPMQCHLARCLDAKVKSFKDAEYGCRCTATELSDLETRALFYWQKANDALQKVKKNQRPAIVKNRLFKEAGDGDLPLRLVEKLQTEAEFSIGLSQMGKGLLDDALTKLNNHPSPWAAFRSAQIYRKKADECKEAGKEEASVAMLRKSRDLLYKTSDKINEDKTHELNYLVNQELDDIEIEIQGSDWGGNDSGSGNDSFHTPHKNPSHQRFADTSVSFSHSTPRAMGNGTHQRETTLENGVTPSISQLSSQSQHGISPSPRPSPERLDSQIKSLGYNQTTLFRMVLDRNEELVLMHSRIMEEHGNHNTQLQDALTENKKLMEELKVMLVENRDMLKGIKSEIAIMKSSTPGPPTITTASPQSTHAGIPPGTSLLMAPASRGPIYHAHPGFPGHQPQAYPGYILNSPMAPHGYPRFPANGTPAAHLHQHGKPPQQIQQPGMIAFSAKLKPGGPMMGTMGGHGTGEEEDVDAEGLEHLEHTMEDYVAMYPEYFTDQDPSQYSQYYTPDSHMQDWSLRSTGMVDQGSLPLSVSPALPGAGQPPPAPLTQSRMPMPQPGFFASALRGQSLQYGQQATSTPQHTLNSSGISTATQGNTPIFSALSNVEVSGAGSAPSPAITTQANGLKEALIGGQAARPFLQPGTTSEDLGSNLGFKVLFHIKARLLGKNVQGGITILLGPNNTRTTVMMMSDSEEMLFQHDAKGLVLRPSTFTNPTGLSWSANKIGSMERETVTIVTIPESMGNLLRDALQKSSASAAAAGSGLLSTPPSSAKVTLSTSQSMLGKNNAAAGAGSKTTFGGFSFSGTPILTPAQHEREKATAHKGLTSPVKSDGTKPFAGFSLNVPKYNESPQVASVVSPTKKEDDRVEEFEPNVDFKPVIPLPELVEKTTGEENETVIFVDRCRLYRFDPASKQWKERGVGELKILGDGKEHKYRIVMRRDQIFKLCANHSISSNMKLSPMAGSDKTWCYGAMDFSDEEMKVEQLAVRFKNADKAKTFKDVFEDCVSKTTKEDDKNKKKPAGFTDTPSSASTTSKPTISFALKPSTPAAPSSKPSETQKAKTTPTATTNATSLSELFKPKPGVWECEGCYCHNGPEHKKCPACGKNNPGEPSQGATQQPTFGSNAGTAGKFVFGNPNLFGASKPPAATSTNTTPSVSTTTPAPKLPPMSAAPASGSSSAVPLSEMFKPKAGFWECDGCLCSNGPEHAKCPACGKANPNAEPDSANAAAAGGFTFGSQGGVKPGGGFSFGTLGSSQPTTKPSGFEFGSSPAATTTTTATPATTTTGGFTFGSGGAGGFSFGSLKTAAASSTPSLAPTTITTTAMFTKPTASVTPASSNTQSSKSTSEQPSGLLASLLTGDKDSKPKPADTTTPKTSGFDFNMTPSAPASTSKTSSSGFNFSFQKSPNAKTGSGVISSTTPARVPNSPEVDEHGLYVTKEGEDSHIHFEPIIQLPDKVDTKTGEEEEKVLFESRARMYRFVNGEWKEKGIGVMKILKHKDTQKARVVMRRDQVLKLCCNHVIKPDLSLQPMAKMEGKAWLWYALDFSEEEGKMEQLAVRFKKPETAAEFKKVFDECKAASVSASNTPTKDKQADKQDHKVDSDDDVIFIKEEKSPGFSLAPKESLPITVTTVKPDTKAKVHQTNLFGSGDEVTTAAVDEDVIFVKEEQATPEQKALAAKFQFSPNFYLYETRKPCKGCLGCTDGEGLPPFAKTRLPSKTPDRLLKSYAAAAKSPVQPTLAAGEPRPGTTATPVFGSFTSTTTPKTDDTKPAAAGTIGKSIFGSGGLGADSGKQQSLFGSPGEASKSSVFGSGLSNTSEDFSSLVKGTTSPQLATAGSASSTPTPSLATTNSKASPFGDFVFGAGSATPDFSSLASSGQASFLKKSETGTPFRFAGAGQQLFGAGGGGGGGGGDGFGDSEVTPSQDIHFEPIIPLPDLVEVKTGEEDWKVVFSHRAKVFKYDSASTQWKERGIGDIKILNKDSMYRVLQRREQVLKVSCNHLISKDMKLNPMTNSDKAWCWVATDLAEEEPTVQQLAVKFKNKELAMKFKSAFEDCQQKLIEKEETTVTSTTVAPDSTTDPKSSSSVRKEANVEQKEHNCQATAEQHNETASGEQRDVYDDDDYEDDDDDYMIVFEKRATLNCYIDGKLKNLGTGQMCITFDEDLNGNKIEFTNDNGDRLACHVICRDHELILDSKNKSCEWRPLDYTTDEAVRRHFRVTFSSSPAVEEFAKIFMEGKRLALESDLFELTTDIDVPEVFSHGDIQK